jgi:pyruvate dehydrogenase E2 component (dihydrolipoamide acetyltransferase)
MPSLGADMEHGKMVEWLVKPGDYVHRGDIVAVVDTDKTVMDVESFEEGVVAELLVDVGTTVPIGTPLARITRTPDDGGGQSGPQARRPPGRAASAKAQLQAEPQRETQAETPAPQAAGPAVVVPPPVRHLAHQLGVDTEGIRGTGKNGAVTRADVEHAAAARPATEKPAPEVSGAAVAGARATGAQVAGPQVAARVRSSPRARRLAEELGVDLHLVPGTGPGGAVTEADIRLAASAPFPQPPAEAPLAEKLPAEAKAAKAEAAAAYEAAEAVPSSEARDRAASLRRAIGSLMSKSKNSIPHYYLSTTLDLRAAIAWMQLVNQQRPVASRLVPSALLLKATALAARDVPEVNGFYTDGEFHPSTSVHLGVAVALRQGGLVAPAIHDADTLPVDVLMQKLRDLVSRARAGRLQRAEMADPTITVTNLGDLGVESVYGVIYPPQVAMVGLGRVVEQPWAHDGMVGVRPAVTATLSADHRVSDGLRGGRFLTRIEELLQKPEEL